MISYSRIPPAQHTKKQPKRKLIGGVWAFDLKCSECGNGFYALFEDSICHRCKRAMCMLERGLTLAGNILRGPRGRKDPR